MKKEKSEYNDRTERGSYGDKHRWYDDDQYKGHVKCYSCRQYGHISVKCPNKSSNSVEKENNSDKMSDGLTSH